MKIVPHFYENCAALLWFVREAPRYGIAALFVKRATIFAKCTAIRRTRHIFTAKGAVIRQKARIVALYKTDCGALQDGALRYGHQSVALLVGESGTNAAMFLSASVACFFNSF